ncbi:hypothetical protein AB0P21_14845 [Kribbella sp. NPDC056861]|uniref:hypothetical protein n=1 Tax=Kribbella sp. NPDC056861 TaxID=3154857 RepID=UPI003425E6CA
MIAVVACATTVLTSCGPPITGPAESAALGMTVDAAGHPVIVLQNCSASVVQLELTASSTQVVFDNEKPPPAVDEIPLTGTADWRPNQPTPKLNPTDKVTIRAWSEGHRYFGRRTEFTLADLKALKPGQVRHDWRPAGTPPSYGASPGTPQYRITSLDDFTPDFCP